MNLLERLAGWLGNNSQNGSDHANDALRGLLEHGRAMKRAERYDDALQALSQAGELLATTPHDPAIDSLIQLNRADIYIQQARWDDANQLLDHLRQVTQSDQRRAAYVHNTLGVLAQARGDWDSAREHYETARRTARDYTVPGAEGRAEGHLADTYLHEGNAAYGTHLLNAALEKLRTSGDVELTSYFTGRLGEAMIASGQENEGREMLSKALRLARAMQYRTYERHWYLALAEQAMVTGQYDSARTHYMHALNLFDEERQREEYVVLLCRLSRTCLRLREYEDALGYARRAVEFSDSMPPTDPAYLMAQGGVGVVLRHLYQYETALPYLLAALSGYESLDTTDADYSYVDILRNLAMVKAEVENMESASAAYQQALDEAEKRDLPLERAAIYRDMGVLAARHGDSASAIKHWSDALELYEGQDEYARVARIYSDIANLRRQHGESERALKTFEKALTAINLADDTETRGVVLANAAVAYFDSGDIENAESFMVEAIQLAQNIDDRRAESMRRGNYGWLLLATGRTQRALETLQFARQQSTILQLDLAAAVQTDNIGLAYAVLGDYAQAEQHHRQAIDLHATVGDAYWLAMAQVNLGHTLILRDNMDDAGYYLTQALEAARSADHHDLITRALTGQAHIARLRDNLPRAQTLAQEAIEHGRRANQRQFLADALVALAHIHAMQGESAAQALWEEAAALYAIQRLPHPTPEWL